MELLLQHQDAVFKASSGQQRLNLLAVIGDPAAEQELALALIPDRFAVDDDTFAIEDDRLVNARERLSHRHDCCVEELS